jgi:RimJ/RimL family protein N-acetyltransferase
VPAPLPVLAPDPPLAGERVSLRPWGDADLDAMVAICRDPEVARFTRVPEPYTEADARVWIAAQPGRRRDGEGVALAIVDRPGAAPVGSIGLHVDPADRDVAEIGYNVAPHARGRGLASEALRLVAGWALAEWRMGRLQLTTHVGNAASQRVAEKAGFRREGVLRSWAEIKGARVDLVMFSRLPGDP